MTPYFRCDICRAWDHCLPVWLEAGRVRDFPHGIRLPEYAPTDGARLGNNFAAEFHQNLPFFISKLRTDDPTIRLIAFDLLEIVAVEYVNDKLPDALTQLDDPIPDVALTDIRRERRFNDYSQSTVGSFLKFRFEKR